MTSNEKIIGTTSKELPDGTVQETHEELGTTSSKKPFFKVGFKLGTTINTGNYNSMRADVWVEIPCEEEEVDEAAEIAKEWVDGKLADLVSDINGGCHG